MRLAILLALVGVAIGAKRYGERRWQAESSDLRRRLAAGRAAIVPKRVDFRELDGVPAPVQRHFRTVMQEGQPMIAALRAEHRGTFNMGKVKDAWKPFTSEQKVITRRPGFDWNARVSMMPGIPVYVRDSYIAGQGILQAAVLGMITVADMPASEKMAEGELMRFLAEAAWYPTALLPSQGVRWTPVDNRSARATYTEGDIRFTMLFTFNGQGLIDTVSTPTRGRMVDGRIVPTPWQGRFWDYERRNGMLVPLSGEVSWLMDEGPRPYWRGRIGTMEYEFAS
ncbi:MAG: DUF6920 family protein [Noviherbaspirillum sp.]